MFFPGSTGDVRGACSEPLLSPYRLTRTNERKMSKTMEFYISIETLVINTGMSYFSVFSSKDRKHMTIESQPFHKRHLTSINRK